jgi:hypothetical protein
MIELPAAASPPTMNPVRRVVLAGVVGGVLPIGLLGWTFLMAHLFPESQYCGEYTGCAGYLVLAWEAGRWVALVLAWPLLLLLRVRPAWQAALLAALFMAGIWQAAWALIELDVSATLLLLLFSGVFAYPAAAWLTTPRTPRPALAVSVVLAFALYALATLVP